jgi:putative tricarboxylic transport membrane protein
MFAGLYYGAMYGSSTTSILLNTPGESGSIITALEGNQMARRGRGAAALATAAIGSFVAGTIGTLLLSFLAPVFVKLAIVFGPAEYFSLMVMGLVCAIVLARGSIVKAIAMIVFGLLLSTVGTDLETGEDRMTMGIAELSDGVDFAVLAMGIFGFAEIIRNLENVETRDVVRNKIGRLLPGWQDIKDAAMPVLRGTGIGAILGILPGNGAVLGPFASYTIEKKIAKDPSRFGKGAIEGVAGPEAANNAGAQTAFIPLLTLGIPPNAVMALMVGAMTIHGIIPGPQVMTKNPELFWGMVASMWIGNLMLLIINLPLVGIWVRLLKVPYRLLFPAILIFCCIGIYSINNSVSDVLGTAFFGFIGFTLIKFGFEPAPMLLGFVLGKLMEEKLRQALIISRGSFETFIDRPISLGLLVVAVILLVLALLPSIQKGRDEVFTE